MDVKKKTLCDEYCHYVVYVASYRQIFVCKNKVFVCIISAALMTGTLALYQNVFYLLLCKPSNGLQMCQGINLISPFGIASE